MTPGSTSCRHTPEAVHHAAAPVAATTWAQTPACADPALVSRHVRFSHAHGRLRRWTRSTASRMVPRSICGVVGVRKALAVCAAVGLGAAALLAGTGPAAAKKVTPPACYPSSQNADLTNGQFNRAQLPDGNFTGATLTGADFVKANVSQGVFDGSVASGTSQTDLVNFSNSTLSGASFAGAQLDKVTFSKADITGVNFMGASMPGVAMYKSSGASVNLASASMSSAYMKYVTLSGVNFYNANLKKANLTGADITGANFTGAKFKRTICPDGKKTNTGC